MGLIPASDRVGISNNTPVNAVNATGTLTLTGDVLDAETVTIGSRVYEFKVSGSASGSNLKVDLDSVAVAATGTLTLTGDVLDAETVTIGSRVYEFKVSGSASGSNLKVDLDSVAVAATGTLTFSGVVSDGETVTIGSRVYEFDTNSSVTGGNISVDVSGGVTASQAVTALVAAVTGDVNAVVTAVDGAGDTVVVTAKSKGVVGNSFASTETCVNAAWGAGTLSGGVDSSAANAITALVSTITGDANAVVTAVDGAGDTVVVTAKSKGVVGNSIASTETMSNGSWGAATLSGGVDSSAANAITALVSTITGDANAVVTAVDGAGDTVVVTAKIAGVSGDSIASTETMSNGSWGAATLSGGVDGTISYGSGLWFYDSTYLYFSTSTNTVADKNWRRISLGAAY